MKRNLFHTAEGRHQQTQRPRIQRWMRLPAQIHFIAAKDVMRVSRMQRIDLGVRRLGDIDVVVALNCLVEKGNSDHQNHGQGSP